MYIRLVWLICLLSSCSSFKPLESLDMAVADQAKKMQMLSKALDAYNRSVYWGDIGAARVYLRPEIQQSYSRELHRRGRKEKITEILIEDISFDGSGDTATVDIEQKYISKGQIMVKTRYEQMTWKFHRFSTGWVAHEVSEVDELGEETDKSKVAG